MSGGGIPRIAEIQAAVAREFGVPVSIMREPLRRLHARPRQAAMALSVLLTNHSYTRVGDLFGGRDHSTVIHACRAVAKRRRSDAALHSKMRRISFQLLARVERELRRGEVG